MTSGTTAFIRPDRRDVVPDLPLWRVNLMRVGYAVMGVGLAVVRWPDVIARSGTMPLYEGVVAVLLTAMSLLPFLALRYPVRLLPILLFESLWKLIWLSAVALPALVAGDVDAALSEVIVSCSLVVIILAVVPWGHVWRQYVVAKGTRGEEQRPDVRSTTGQPPCLTAGVTAGDLNPCERRATSRP